MDMLVSMGMPVLVPMVMAVFVTVFVPVIMPVLVAMFMAVPKVGTVGIRLELPAHGWLSVGIARLGIYGHELLMRM